MIVISRGNTQILQVTNGDLMSLVNLDGYNHRQRVATALC